SPVAASIWAAAALASSVAFSASALISAVASSAAAFAFSISSLMVSAACWASASDFDLASLQPRAATNDKLNNQANDVFIAKSFLVEHLSATGAARCCAAAWKNVGHVPGGRPRPHNRSDQLFRASLVTRPVGT